MLLLSDPWAMALSQVLAWPIAVLLFGALPHPWRARVSSAVAAFAGGVYLTGPLGLAEVPLALCVLVFAILGQADIRALGVAWCLHAAVDVAHDLLAPPVLPAFPTFSVGCAVIDPLLAVWYFAGAPSLLDRWRRR